MLKNDIVAAAFVALAFALTAIFQSIPSPNDTGEGIPPISEPHRDGTEAASNGQNSRPRSVDVSVLQAQTERPHGDEHEKKRQVLDG